MIAPFLVLGNVTVTEFLTMLMQCFPKKPSASTHMAVVKSEREESQMLMELGCRCSPRSPFTMAMNPMISLFDHSNKPCHHVKEVRGYFLWSVYSRDIHW